MSRKLVTLREVNKIIPIKGADFIELAVIGGWQCIVKKGEFKEGDVGVYFEIDSMLPLDEKYSFLGKTTQDKTGEGYRIRTMKMRKQLSQGLLLPLNKFPPLSVLKPAEDLTKELGVWLYEPKQKQVTNTNSLGRQGKQVSMFPEFLRKTDQERIQNKMHYFETYADDQWETTCKLDGSSMTVWCYDKAGHLAAGKNNKPWKNWLARKIELIKFLVVKPKLFGVCSRNINLQEAEGNAFWAMANELGLKEKMKGFNVALQGELIGPKIQNNHENVEKNEFYVFDVFDIDKQEYMLPKERILFLTKNFPDVKRVPRYDYVQLKNHTFDSLQAMVTGEGMNKGTIREGMVFKHANQPGLSFKCISNKYLLRYEE